MSVSSLKSQVEESQQEQQETVSPALAFSANDFASLEDRILRTIELVKRERQARTAAECQKRRLEQPPRAGVHWSGLRVKPSLIECACPLQIGDPRSYVVDLRGRAPEPSVGRRGMASLEHRLCKRE